MLNRDQEAVSGKELSHALNNEKCRFTRKITPVMGLVYVHLLKILALFGTKQQ